MKFLRPIAYSIRKRLALLPSYSVGNSNLSGDSYTVAHDPGLIPPQALMKTEGIDVLEEWFRWGEEWSMLLRFYGEITCDSSVLEIGCGLGRIAFPLRFVLIGEGTYEGFDICRYKIDFLKKFHEAYPNFRFCLADIRNTNYNPLGKINAVEYRFPYAENSFDLVFASSVFTHLLPESTRHYFAESARVLRSGGRCIFSFFLLDFYNRRQPRPLSFSDPLFNIDSAYADYGEDFAVSNLRDPEQITGYKRSFIEECAREAGLEFAQNPVPGLWSGSFSRWVGTQDIIVLTKP